MRVATLHENAVSALALVDPEGGRLWRLEELMDDAPADMVSLIEHYPRLAGRLAPRGAGRALGEAALLAPIPRPPRNVFCIGKNYRAHAEEFSRSGFDASAATGEVPEVPIVFSKATSAVIGPGEAIRSQPELTAMVDYEAELAVVIGRGGRHIRRQQALDHVFGYTLLNDVTARDLQRRHRQWLIGKSLDTFCPMGPWITTADEVDSADLTIRCWVNDELRQEANTRDLIFDVPALIEAISRAITLAPGDIIATGTPAGVGAGFDPPRFLKPGDRVVVAAEPLGRLENVVV